MTVVFLTPYRVHTLAMPVVQDLADMYKAVDGAATINLLAKLAVEKSYHAKLDDTRSSLAVSASHHTCTDSRDTLTLTAGQRG